METCRLLWTIPNYFSESLPPLAPRLIFPPLSNDTIRKSEQEARFTFVSVIERSTKYFYSVETPTRQLHSFTGKKNMSAQTDLTSMDGCVCQLKRGPFDHEKGDHPAKKLMTFFH